LRGSAGFYVRHAACFAAGRPSSAGKFNTTMMMVLNHWGNSGFPWKSAALHDIICIPLLWGLYEYVPLRHISATIYHRMKTE